MGRLEYTPGTSKLWEGRKLALILTLAAALRAPSAAADAGDAPTQQRRLLRGTSHVAGELTAELGFPAYTYEVVHDSFARIVLTTTNLPDRPHDNGGHAWRPFLRVIGNPSQRRHGDGWSTNGLPGDPDVGRAPVLIPGLPVGAPMISFFAGFRPASSPAIPPSPPPRNSRRPLTTRRQGQRFDR